MPAGSVGCKEMVAMLRAAAARIEAEHEYLSRLDSATGDGDHGTTMRRAMSLAVKAAEDDKSGRLADLLGAVGWAVLGVDGGATGPLLGTFIMGMGQAAGDRNSLDSAGLAEVFEAGLAALRKQTRAQVGDKTMVDALVPAVEALRAAAGRGSGVADAMVAAAEAAQQAASATSRLRAKFGRARNLGDRSIGTADPGATSVGLVFRGFADALAQT